MVKFLIFVMMIFVMGCPKKPYVKPPEEPVKKVEEAKPAEVKKEVIEEKVLPKPAEVKKEVIEEKVLAKLPEEIMPEVLKDIHFDFDKYDIRPDARPILSSIAEWLKKNRDINILLEGHCDERGTNEYNLALGENRAKSTKDYLVALGISPGRMKTISYGEERPLCLEKNEDCWQRNRRAHFVIAK